MADNLYEILGIQENATAAEIRKSYFTLIRKFSNQTHPDEFQKIRKAYEILSSPEARTEYDAKAKYGGEISRLEQESLEAMEEEDYEKAISGFKNILMIEPSLHDIRYRLAMALSLNGDTDKAIKQFTKIVSAKPEIAHYRTSMAYAYSNAGMEEEAIRSFKEAYLIDPTDPNIIFSLADVYVRQGRYIEARKYVEQAMPAKENAGFHQFLYLVKLLKIDIHERELRGFQLTMDRIERLLDEYPDEKEYAAEELYNLALELNKNMMFTWVARLTERSMEIDPENKALRSLHEYAGKNEPLFREYELAEKDEKILPPFKHASFLYLFGETLEEAEYKESLEIMFENLDFIARNQPAETISSVKRMMIKYPELYEARKDLFEEIRSQAIKAHDEMDQFERLKNDAGITNSIKRLCALYLSDSSQEERSDYFNDILDEMSYESEDLVRQSISRLKQVYPSLYRLNPDFFTEIKKKLDDARSGSNTYTGNNGTRPSRVQPPSNTSSCFVATAAYGTPLAKELDILRFWRDHYLKSTKTGTAFVSVYYKIGPAAAGIVRKSPALKALVRKIVAVILRRLEMKYTISKAMTIKRKGDTYRWTRE